MSAPTPRPLALSLALCTLLAACGTASAVAVDAGVPGASPDASDAAATDGSASGKALALAPGEVAELTVTDGRAATTLASPAGTERYVVVLASTKLDSSRLNFGYAAARGGAEPDTEARVVTGCSLSPAAWQGKPAPAEPEPQGQAPVVGSTRTLQVPVGNRLETITAQVAATSARAVVWLDTTPAHPATLDPAFMAEFLADFDKTILPRERAVFGMESDIDGDGRVGLVFSPLTRDSAVAFFRQCDLSEAEGCGGQGGNKAELLYLTPPANIAPPYNTPAAIKEILAHELGHLLHFNRKVLRNKATSWPDASYMIEGFGGFAQDVVGFQSGNLYVTKAGLDGIGEVSLAEVLGTRSTYDSAKDGLLRGAGYLFVRYLYDRAGGDSAKADGTLEGRGGTAFLRDVLDAKESVAERTASGAKTTPADLATDFYTTLALSNGEKGGATAPKNPCFAYLPTQLDPVTGKQRGADLYASFHGQSMKGPKTQPLEAADGSIRAGGVEYLTLSAEPGTKETRIQLTTDGAALPRVRVARLQ